MLIQLLLTQLILGVPKMKVNRVENYEVTGVVINMQNTTILF